MSFHGLELRRVPVVAPTERAEGLADVERRAVLLALAVAVVAIGD